MRFSLVALLILAFAVVAYGQKPAIACEANPNLQIVDANWFAKGGTLEYPQNYAGLYETPHRNQVVSTAAVLVKNTSGKTIKSFDLDYVFADAGNSEFLRYRFHAKGSLKVGKTKKFSQDIFEKAGRYRKRYSLTHLKFAKLLATNEAQTRVIVCRIEYADGSVWERP